MSILWNSLPKTVYVIKDFCSEEGGNTFFRNIFNSLLQILLKTVIACQTTRCRDSEDYNMNYY
jgi:hypothetical protein